MVRVITLSDRIVCQRLITLCLQLSDEHLQNCWFCVDFIIFVILDMKEKNLSLMLYDVQIVVRRFTAPFVFLLAR